jgi:hypothetical protein
MNNSRENGLSPSVFRTACICAILCLGVGLFAWVANQHYPLREWLFVMYARYWLFAGLFALASLSTGLRVVKAILPEPPRLGEQLVLGFALGVLVFALGVFLGGLAGLFGRVFFFAWPGLMLAFGARQGWRDLRRWRKHLGRFGARLFLPRGWVETLAAILLVVSSIAVYLQVMTPLNVGGDSYWYHLPIAEHYAASGAIRPFAEGWYLGAYPHLASLLYTWAFQSPGELFDHVVLSSHLEWALFLATLGGVSALTRRLLAGTRTPYAAAALFLFPGIFLYDSSLITGADHVLAFWAPALGLAMIRLGRRFAPREALLSGVLIGAAVLTKYQASYYFAASALLVLALVVRTRRLRPALVWALAGLAVSSAHWLKNWIFYGDPFYPMLGRYLPAHPFHEGAADRIYWDAQFLLTGTFWERVGKTLAALVDYSFVPHDWSGFHGDRPVFGSLFTLLIPVLFFLRSRRRIWLLIIGIHVGIVVWFVTTHQDRYLQALLPWMAACTAAILVLAWQSGRWVRIAVAVLVLHQVVWGSDVYFLRSHNMIGDSPLKSLVDLMAAGHEKRYQDRRKLHGGGLQAVGSRLPPGAKVLVHDRHDRLGLGAASIQDSLAWQGAVDYMVIETPDAAAELWRKMGATHLMWWSDYGGPFPEELAREAVFARTARLWGTEPEVVDDKRLSKLQDAPSDRTRSATPTTIAWLGCSGDPPLGMYTPRGLVARTPATTLSEDRVRDAPLDAVAEANAVILRPSCGYLSKAVAEIPNQFVTTRKAGDVAVWVRR